MKTKTFVFAISGAIVIAFGACRLEKLQPWAEFTISPESGNEGTSFTLDASGSFDPEKGVLKYKWDYETDGTFDTEFSTAARNVHVFSRTGTFMVTLEVMNESGLRKSASKKLSVSLSNRPPVIPSLILPSDQATDVGITPDLKWSCADPDGDNLTYDVYFGTQTTPVKTGSTIETTYKPGTLLYDTGYYWKIIATDPRGGVTSGPVWSFRTSKQLHPPIVQTEAVTGITQTTASSGGTVTDDGGAQVTARGICWSETNLLPVITDNNISGGSGTGTFVCGMSNLKIRTRYHVRAYATNLLGTGYGDTLSFTTQGPLVTSPEVTTDAVTVFNTTTAVVGGNVVSDGGSAITERGFYYGLSADLPANGRKVLVANGTGPFSYGLTDLARGTTYYVMAFAGNGIAAPGYGKVEKFTTLLVEVVKPAVKTAIGAITFSTADVGGEVTSDGGSPVTEWGIYISKESNPSSPENKVKYPGGGTGKFMQVRLNLTPATNYYVSAYATNIAGTGHGEILTFKTNPEPAVPTVVTVQVLDTTATSATVIMAITDLGDSPVTEFGICYGGNPGPDLSGSVVRLYGGSKDIFRIGLTGLKSKTKYYARAYAKNNSGAGFGLDLTFTTK